MFSGFNDRKEGGKALAEKLFEFKDSKDAIVLALPRGGVPVAFEVANSLGLPLDVLVVRKLGIPGQEELAFGAIASGGITVFNQSLVHALKMTDSMIEKVIRQEKAELERRERKYRQQSHPLNLKDKTVIIVDDGLATGATMRAAAAAVKTENPKEIIVAAPVASRETCEDFRLKSNSVCVCSITPEPFYGVGLWYQNFDQTTDEEVQKLLIQAENRFQAAKTAV